MNKLFGVQFQYRCAESSGCMDMLLSCYFFVAILLLLTHDWKASGDGGDPGVLLIMCTR
jgi:hypothetical protein